VPPVVTSIALYGSVCFCDWSLASPTCMFDRPWVDRYIQTCVDQMTHGYATNVTLSDSQNHFSINRYVLTWILTTKIKMKM
jgi:hypothetical protein